VGKLLEKARQVAVKAHANQTRDNGKTPYVSHLEGVVKLLQENIVDNGQEKDRLDKIFAAGMLHDIIEDTHWSYSDVQKEFGIDVAIMVRDVSVDTRKTKAQREEEVLKTAGSMAYNSALVKLADMLHNLSDMGCWDWKRKLHYKNEKALIVEQLKAGPMRHDLDNKLLKLVKAKI